MYIVTGFLTIVMIIFYTMLVAQSLMLNRTLDSLKSQVNIIENYIETNSEILMTQEERSQLEEIIEKAMGNVPDWSELLIEIDQCRPEGIIIHTVKGQYSESNAMVIINGVTNNQQNIKVYIDELNNLTRVNDTEFNFIRETNPQDTANMEFEILIYHRQENQDKLEGE